MAESQQFNKFKMDKKSYRDEFPTLGKVAKSKASAGAVKQPPKNQMAKTVQQQMEENRMRKKQAYEKEMENRRRKEEA